MLLATQTERGHIRGQLRGPWPSQQRQTAIAANSGVPTLCQALTLPLALLVVVLQPCKLDIYQQYFTEKWGSSRLSDLFKFMHPGRNKIGLWHLLPMTVPSELPDWTKRPLSQEEGRWRLLSVYTVAGCDAPNPWSQNPRAKSNYLQECFLRTSKGQTCKDFGYHHSSVGWNQFLPPPVKYAQTYKFQEAWAFLDEVYPWYEHHKKRQHEESLLNGINEFEGGGNKGEIFEKKMELKILKTNG